MSGPQAASSAMATGGIPPMFRPWFAPVWIVFVGYMWWCLMSSQMEDTLSMSVRAARVAAALGAAGHIVGNALEALFYTWWWSLRGIRLRYPRMFEALVTISVLDLSAGTLTRLAESHPGLVASMIEVFVGFGVLDREGASGLQVAFGSLGFLCVARLVATAAIQQKAVGGTLHAPLLLTSAVWLIGRLSAWWMFDLARGISPMP